MARRLATAVLVLGAACWSALWVSGGATADSTVSVRVDVGAFRQVIQGFGSSERVWSDPHLAHSPNVDVPPEAQNEILAALYRRLGLTQVRDVLDQGVERTPGASPTFTGKLADAHISFVKQAKTYGLKVFFPGPVYLEPWMTADNPGAYVDWAMAMLEHWRSLGAEPPYYAPLNEPQVDHNFPPEWLHQVVLQLGARLKSAGFDTKLVIPDDENPIDAYRRAVAVLSDPNARQYVGAVAYHIYRIGGPTDYARIRDLAAQYNLPVWMTEYGNTAYVSWPAALNWAAQIHDLLTVGGVSAIDYIWGFFGSWAPQSMIGINFADGRYQSFFYRPVYYLTGQYSRFVRPGYVRVVATPGRADGVLTSAFRGVGKVVVVAVNTRSANADLHVVFRGATVTGRVQSVRTSARVSWRQLRPVALSGSAFTSTLPSQSVTTYVASVR